MGARTDIRLMSGTRVERNVTPNTTIDGEQETDKATVTSFDGLIGVLRGVRCESTAQSTFDVHKETETTSDHLVGCITKSGDTILERRTRLQSHVCGEFYETRKVVTARELLYTFWSCIEKR